MKIAFGSISETGISKAELVKKRVKVHRNVLLSELDPMDIISALSKSKCFPESVIDSICNASSGYERVNIISTFVENGSPEVVNEFRSVLENLGIRNIVELIDPSNVHNKAGKITAL